MLTTDAHNPVSEMTPQLITLEEISRDKTSAPLEESTNDMSVSLELEHSESTVSTGKTASSAFGMSGLETQSEALTISTVSPGLRTPSPEVKDTVTWDSPSHKFSSDQTMTSYSELTADLLSVGSQDKVTGTWDPLVANGTTIGTTDAFNVSEVEEISKERSDSSSLQATVSDEVVWAQNVTTPGSLSERTQETDHVATMVYESHAPSEIVHMTTRRTIEDSGRTPNTTDALTPRHALLSTSEAARTPHTNETEPAGKTSFSSRAGGTVSTMSEVASKAPPGSMMEDSDSPKGHLIGIAVGATVAVVILVVIIIIILAVIYRRRRRKSCYITDHDLKDYRSLMKRQHHEPQALTSPSVDQPISPFSEMFPQDVPSNGPPVSKYRMVNFDRSSDDGLDGIEIVHDDSREQRSPKEIPVQEYTLTTSGYPDCSYSVNSFRPAERKSLQTNIDLVKSDAETKFDANETSEKDEKAIEE